MKLVSILLCSISCLLAQPDDPVFQDEVEDPDERQFTNLLLNQLSAPLETEVKDSTVLPSSWLTPDVAKIIIRQRLQYSASLEGWRLLNKGRIQTDYFDLVFLAEQDPGELQLTDHSILTVNTNRIPGIEKLVLGDFNIAWGAGLSLDQKSSRMSLSPGSLARKPQLTLTPHYSTRETDYFQGMGSKWQVNDLEGLVFWSSRKTLGSYDAGTFREDSDGIHPVHRTFEEHTLRDIGFAGIYDFGDLNLFAAVLYNSVNGYSARTEWGLHWDLSKSHFVQIFMDDIRRNNSRILINWSFRAKLIQLSARYRYFQTMNSTISGSGMLLLGSRAKNEQGFSLRLQVRPRKQLSVRYALDKGSAIQLSDIQDNRRVLQHKVQIQRGGKRRQWQLDLNHKEEGPIIPDDIWSGVTEYVQVTKLALSLNEKLRPAWQYRVNFKTAVGYNDLGWLIQQRILWSENIWKSAVGYSRYTIPRYTLRLSIYESGLVESFNFFTAYEDGQRWFFYLKYNANRHAGLEVRLAQTKLYGGEITSKHLELNFQLSIVL